MKSEVKLDFNDNQDCKSLMTGMIDDRTFISWSNYFRDAMNNIKERGYHFNRIAEMDIITLAHKRGMTYDFYLKYNMHAAERKLNQNINKDKNLINKLPATWVHPLNRI